MGNMQEVHESLSLLTQVTEDLRIPAGVSVVLLLLLWTCFRSGRRSQVTVVFKRLDAAGLQQLSATVAAAMAEARPNANDEAMQRVADAVERLKTLQYQFQNDIIRAHEQIWQGLCNLKEKAELGTATLQPMLAPIPTEEPRVIPEPARPDEPRKPASRKVSETLPEEPLKPDIQPVVEEKPRPPLPAKLPVPLKNPEIPVAKLPVPLKNQEVPVVKLPETASKLEEPQKPLMKAPEPKADDSPKPPMKPLEPAKKAEEALRPPIRPPEPAKDFPKPPELPKKTQDVPKPPKPEEMKQPPAEEKKEGEAPTGRPTPPTRKPGLVRPKYTPPTTLGNPFGAK